MHANTPQKITIRYLKALANVLGPDDTEAKMDRICTKLADA